MPTINRMWVRGRYSGGRKVDQDKERDNRHLQQTVALSDFSSSQGDGGGYMLAAIHTLTLDERADLVRLTDAEGGGNNLCQLHPSECSVIHWHTPDGQGGGT